MPHTRRTFLRAASVSALGLTLAKLRPARAADLAFGAYPFSLGIASGYPEPEAVVLWTKLAPEPLVPGGGMPHDAVVAVDWEIADDDTFRRIARRGTAYATPDWGHSVHVEVTGLSAARDYWYRFTAGGEQSPVGRTRTAPARNAAMPQMKLAVASCQAYEHGYYCAYRAMAVDDLDLVVHVGDYIYESRGVSRVRSHDLHEAFTLEDYRQRYALYKSDPMLQAAHAAAPWMVVPDDHEVANDFAGDVSAENDTAAFFLARRAAAFRAYYEHLPLPRRLVPLGAHQRLHTRRGFGNLVELVMLDGRQYRSDQACGGRGLVSPCDELMLVERTMLGAEQEAWLERTLSASTARWTLLGQQTLLSHFDQSGPLQDPMYWSDGWNGYPAARDRLVEFLATAKIANPVVLSGDIHAFVIADVHARAEDPASPVVAAELVTTSISSPGPAQANFDAWMPENPNVHLARSDRRGYLKLAVRPDHLHADLVAVDDHSSMDSGVHVLASYDVADGTPGVARR